MTHPKVVLLKGNGPISINNELVELHPVTTAHGAIGFPLKSLRAENICMVSSSDLFWESHKLFDLKPCCFVYAYETLEERDQEKIVAEKYYTLDEQGVKKQ